ncbi:chromodomain-helicase-DNA-binding protein 1-like isoform X2 [Microcaecilia unicolor]|uniref:Chromodomain-helicase-DNA-binding protein 1-like n=1 Tax=Microcaecilia unicolor TaxID=1415580 RepID=A0A6P7Y4R8_9AMPH|nr:chromodomain-helicase-DNA-binding protein 1-like isoform X2 [Microcaecilia unicolor]
MSMFVRRLLSRARPIGSGTEVGEAEMCACGLTGLQLRPYQLEGINWLVHCFKNYNGCILGDEMGLGKTCQTISLLLYLRGNLKRTDPFLILCPLSVLTNWKAELERFSPGLSVMVYTGDKVKRADLQQDMKNTADFHVLLTTYEICLKDAGWLRNILNWCILVVDEAHRLKNQNSLLHKTLSEFPVGFRILLTGTPIQNNLEELYSLLSFIEPSVFPRELTNEFINYYQAIEKDTKKTEELHSLLQPFLLRREKADVAVDLPKKMELVVYHGMSVLQKKYYKAILMKDLDAFENDTGKKARLVNVLIQLRKCVDHPYLFDGIEPEPFEIGEHLVEASGKLHLLDKMGHRVLLFSQMSRMLDILQDYMEYKGYSYERLDGSVRGEERHLAIKSFSNNSVFVFLLSTKAGGVGMNLTAADTVIFVDSDYNPQNDLQAAARAHRIGQNKPVKVIRLIGRDTVEEIIYRRATSKLRLTNTIMEGGQFAFSGEKAQAPAVTQLNEILKFGLDKLLSCEESTIQEVDLKDILGDSRKGEWVTERPLQQDKEDEGADSESHMYIYEGKDYSKEASSEDKKLFDQLLELQRITLDDAKTEGRSLRNKLNFSLTGQLDLPTRRKRVLSPEELVERQKKKQEAAAKRTRLMEEKKKKREEEEQKKKQVWWKSCGYVSSRITSEDSETEEELEEEEEVSALGFDSRDPEQFSINYVIGDITHPRAGDEDAIIIHCVDDSGRWGRGGLFTALEGRSDQPRKIYEMAGKMKDLVLGGVLLFPIDDKESRSQGHDLLALIVAQHRDRSNNLSGIKLVALEEGLKKIYLAAKKRNASIHLPRIGHATKGFNWYGTERLIRKYLASRGVPTFIYYYPRTMVSSSSSQASAAASRSFISPPVCTNSTEKIAGETKDLPSFMTEVNVYFYNIPEVEKKKLSRYLVSYNGNVEHSFTSETTHLVARVDCLSQAQEIQHLLQDNPKSKIVQPRWLEVCFSKQKKLDTKEYQIDLTRHLANTATCDHA